jgi:geranylgeranyl pyrophosphate synthase
MTPTAESLRAFADGARARVDEALERYLPKPPLCPALLSEAMRYSVFAGGKRLRPLLVLAAADAVGKWGRVDDSASPKHVPDPASLALPAACAVELIHTYSLIHDDLPAMDNDTLRRGRPTLHVVYGDAVAVLAGDALQAEAFALLGREPASDHPAIAERRLHVVARIAGAAGAVGMVGGQTVDVQAAGQVAGQQIMLDAEGLRAMHLMKTGALIRASAASGAIMGGADGPLVGAVDEWGVQVGLAFQIVDDILDVEGDARDLGKTAGKDAAGDKPTYPALFGLDRSRVMAAECAGRAREILARAGLAGSWLPQIAEWVLTRKS